MARLDGIEVSHVGQFECRVGEIGGGEFFGGRRSEIVEAREKRIGLRAHFIVAGPGVMQELFEDVDGFEAAVDDFGAGREKAIAKTPEQIFDAVGDGGNAMQSNLGGGAF